MSTGLAARIDHIPVESGPRIEKAATLAVNAFLMPIGAATVRQQAGMRLIHATLYATRRRAVSILHAQP